MSKRPNQAGQGGGPSKRPDVQGGRPPITIRKRTPAAQLAFKLNQVKEKYKVRYPGTTPIVVASEFGNLNDMHILMREYGDNKAHVSAKLNEIGLNSGKELCTALMAAASNGQADAVRYLCRLRADTTIKDRNNRNALHYLCMFRNIHTKGSAERFPYYTALDILLHYMPLDAINQKNKKEKTPFDMVADIYEGRVKIQGLSPKDPYVKYYAWKLRSEGALRGRREYLQTQCALCIEEFKAGEKPALTKLPCGHIFHEACIEKLVQAVEDRNNARDEARRAGMPYDRYEAVRCPTCRAIIQHGRAPPTQQYGTVKVFKGYFLRALKF
jgi:ferredoxin